MNIINLLSIDSTNKYAKDNLKDLNDKTLISADKQTNGRGRLERKWLDVGVENIYASIVLKPHCEYKEVYSSLTQYLAVVIAKTIEELYTVTPCIKWPNDIQLNNKKVSGILAEGIIENGFIEGLILGFGINLNCSKEIIDSIDQPATSLNIETGMQINKNIFIKKLSDNFCLGYDKFIEEGFSYIKEDYKKRSSFLNKHISVKVFNKTIQGITKDLTDNGALKIVDDNNEEQILYVGDIL